MTVAVTVRPATSDADLAALVEITDAVTPDDPTSLDEMRWTDATYQGVARFVATHGPGTT